MHTYELRLANSIVQLQQELYVLFLQ